MMVGITAGSPQYSGEFLLACASCILIWQENDASSISEDLLKSIAVYS